MYQAVPDIDNGTTQVGIGVNLAGDAFAPVVDRGVVLAPQYPTYRRQR